MKKRTKILSIFIPFILVLVIGLGIVLPTSLADRKDAKQTSSQEEMVFADEQTATGEDTGASTASAGYKGGAIFLEPNSHFNMKGGTISGHNNKYGGAIYISNKAVFTMTGGTIKNNTADYGGAIYVEAGGECIIEGGEISSNGSKKAGPAIYVEKGGILRISKEAQIKDNYVLPPVTTVSEDTVEVGKKGGGIPLHYLYLGSYPQTYVGDTINSELESWFSSENPSPVQNYVNKKYAKATSIYESRTFTSYLYTDGNLYARGPSVRASSSCTYKDNTTVKPTEQIVWFKVEPIKWVILNYDEYKAGAPLEILSEEALTAGISFNNDGEGNDWCTSWMRTWLKDEFFNSAFTEDEKESILDTHLKNNITGGYNKNSNSETNSSYFPNEKETDDKIYLLTYYVLSGENSVNPLKNSSNYKYCSPTDYAMSNDSGVDKSSGNETNYRLGTCKWWLRSAGEEKSGTYYSSVCDVGFKGQLEYEYTANYATPHGIRPALRISI